MQTQPRAERPLGIALIAVLLALNGVVVLLEALGVFGPGPGGALSGFLAVLFGLALLYLAYGMWTLREWAWLTTLILEGLNALFALLTIIAAPGMVGAWISLVIAALIIVYLLLPEIRADFERRRVR